jgi:hypothetical protein
MNQSKVIFFIWLSILNFNLKGQTLKTGSENVTNVVKNSVRPDDDIIPIFLQGDSSLLYYSKIAKVVNILNLRTWVSDSIALPSFSNRCSIQQILVSNNSKIIIRYSCIYPIKKNVSVLRGGGDSIYKFESSLICYSLLDKKILWMLNGSQLDFRDVLVNWPNDNTIGIIKRGGSTKIINVETGKVAKAAHSICWADGKNIVQSLNGRYIIFWNRPTFNSFNYRRQSVLHIWDFETKKVILSKVIRARGVWSVTFNAGDSSIFIGSYNGSLQSLSLSNNKLDLLWKTDRPIYRLTAVPAKQNLIAMNLFLSDSLMIFNLLSMRPAQTFIGPDRDFITGGTSDLVSNYAFSKDGKLFAFVNNEAVLKIYKTDDWTPITSSANRTETSIRASYNN